MPSKNHPIISDHCVVGNKSLPAPLSGCNRSRRLTQGGAWLALGWLPMPFQGVWRHVARVMGNGKSPLPLSQAGPTHYPVKLQNASHQDRDELEGVPAVAMPSPKAAEDCTQSKTLARLPFPKSIRIRASINSPRDIAAHSIHLRVFMRCKAPSLPFHSISFPAGRIIVGFSLPRL